MTNTITTTMQQDYTANQANALDYAMQQVLLDVNTYLPCKVLAVNNGGLSLNVQPLINGLDASGNPINPPIIYNAAIHQLTGGTGANCAGVIIDYAVGDIVGVIFCQRDVSASQGTVLTQEWKTANPPSYRKFNMADAIVIMRLGGPKPVNNFIHLNKDGIIIRADNNPVTVYCANANINTTENTNITATGKVDIKSTGNTEITSSALVKITSTGVTDIDASDVNITASLTTINGNLTVTGTILGASVTTNAGLILDGHVHANGGLPTNPSGPAQN